MQKELENLWEKCVDFHGHGCGGQEVPAVYSQDEEGKSRQRGGGDGLLRSDQSGGSVGGRRRGYRGGHQ